MAGRSDAATDRCSRSTAPSLASFTVCGWAKVVNSASPLFHPIVRFSDAGDATIWIVGFKGTNGRTPSVYSASNTTGIAGAEVALGTWVFVAATLSGTAAAIHTGITPGSLTKVTGTVGGGTPTQFGVFGRSAADGSEWLDGSLAGLRMWTTVLTDAEIVTESQSISAVKTASLWGSWGFASAALTDASGNARNLTAGSTALTSDADPSLGTTYSGSFAAAVTASVGVGAFVDRAAALPIGATAQLGVGAFADRAAALSVGATAAVSLAPVRTTPAALSVGSTAGLVLSPERVTPGALAIATASQLGLVPLADRTSALGVTSGVGLSLDAASDRAGVLAIGATSQVSLAPAADRAAALAITATAQLDVVPVLERAAALLVGAQAVLQLLPGGAVPGALTIAATAQLVATAVRNTPAALSVATVVGVVLSSAVEQAAALAVAAQAQLDVVPTRDLERALAIVARAAVLVQQEAEEPGSLLLLVGAGEPVEWLRPAAPVDVAVVDAGASAPVGWLVSGASRPA